MRTALITGAAGGLGQAFARRLAADGCALILTDLQSCDAIELELRDAGATVWSSPCDLADEEAVTCLIEWTQALDLTVDILINNAADQRLAVLEELTPVQLGRTLRTNVQAPFQLAKALSSGMAARGWGRIVNIVSGSPWSAPPGFIAYATSKMALIGLTKTLAMELGASGVTVNAVSPALTAHPANADVLPPEVWESQRLMQAIKRTAQPEDVVGLVTFLCGDDAAFVTGQTMFANGGGLML